MAFWEEKLETLPRPDLERLQLDLLRETVEVAARSPFYAKRLAGAGISASDITSLEDARRIPFTTKEDLRLSYPYGMLAAPLEEIVRMHASSGTTGKPTVIFHTAADIDSWTNLVARALVMTGVQRGDVFQNMMSYGLFTGGLGLHYGAERIGAMVIPSGAGNTRRQIQFIQDFGTTVVHMTPSYALHVADEMAAMGVDPSSLTLRIAFFGAEPHSESTRLKLEEIYGLDAYNSYGLSEMNGPGVAFECAHKAGMHLWEDAYLLEVVDPETGEPVPEGEVGELVLTTLRRRGMPILRYRTRDLTSIVPGECPCGRTHRRIARIRGRTDDMLVINGVNVFPSQIEHVLMRIPEVGNNYQIVVDKEGHLDRISVRVELYPKMFHGDLRELRRLQERLASELRDEILVRARVELLEPGTLPPSTGKAVRVIDNRKEA